MKNFPIAALLTALAGVAVSSCSAAFTSNSGSPKAPHPRADAGDTNIPTRRLMAEGGGAADVVQTATTPSYKGDLDAEALLSKSTFPIPPDDLIALAKETMIVKGVGTKDDGACLADDFTFRAQFVEVDRDGFLGALGSFNLEDSFDIQQQYFGWTVDPLQPNRVWFLNRQEAKQVNDFAGVKAPTEESRVLILPPQNFHMDFTADGRVQEFGFYTVDRAQGNTGGLGGAFAYFYGVGRPLPFPEAKPYKPSLRRRCLEFVGKIASKLQKKK